MANFRFLVNFRFLTLPTPRSFCFLWINLDEIIRKMSTRAQGIDDLISLVKPITGSNLLKNFLIIALKQ